jgi:hypothetical protein
VKYTIEFGGAPQDVTITTSGPGSGKGLVDFVRDLVSNPLFRPGLLILVDHLSLDPTPINAADVRAQAETVLLLDERIGPSKVAIVVPTPLAFGFARMYELYTERAQVTSKVFYSRSEALKWLESQRPSPDPSLSRAQLPV